MEFSVFEAQIRETATRLGWSEADLAQNLLHMIHAFHDIGVQNEDFLDCVDEFSAIEGHAKL